VEVAVIDTPSYSVAWRPARGGPPSVVVPVDDLSRVGEARRAADALARSCGMDEAARGLLGVVVTEAATNLARHAQRGVMLLRDTSPAVVAGVEMLAVDRGPGMADLARSFADGFSTGGTAGAGLGAMRRLSDTLDVYSVAGQGTVVLARVYSTNARRAAPRQLLDVGVVCVPIDGETACGDGWAVLQDADRALVLLVDGLGHGPNAAQAADVARTVFGDSAGRTPREVVMLMHDALRATRGAAVAVAEVRRTDEGASIALCGVGNTVTAVIGPQGPRSLPSMNGTAGLTMSNVQEFRQPWRHGDLMVMHTDGITSRWRLDAYPGIREHDPAIAAGVLHRDFNRGRDDATVLVLALRPPAAG
jgi:anti-sigma regulatory factor (Ser/Thr protein kinase)